MAVLQLGDKTTVKHLRILKGRFSLSKENDFWDSVMEDLMEIRQVTVNPPVVVTIPLTEACELGLESLLVKQNG